MKKKKKERPIYTAGRVNYADENKRITILKIKRHSFEFRVLIDVVVNLLYSKTK